MSLLREVRRRVIQLGKRAKTLPTQALCKLERLRRDVPLHERVLYEPQSDSTNIEVNNKDGYSNRP